MRGRVIQSTGSWYEVLLDNGASISCRLKGRFRLEDKKLTNPVAVVMWWRWMLIRKDLRSSQRSVSDKIIWYGNLPEKEHAHHRLQH